MPDPRRITPSELRGPARDAEAERRLRNLERRGPDHRIYIGPEEQPEWVAPYVWFQTGMGEDGSGFTIWFRTPD